ncbi:PfkB family carbohydrate kinase [Methylophaga lonarensis]|uniref:PfkB family carbohydrate kinase n=1 Tax=Methylophaga lonarensis TaxID=999151 RepID=UPI003D2A138A
MAHILAIGIATLDIINQVSHYPAEDSEVRAEHQQFRRGGNATNTLVVLSQLGHQCQWGGVLVNEPDLPLILADLQQHQIDYSVCRQLAEGKMPTSYVTQNISTGSRSIVHYRDCPEFSFDDFGRIDLQAIDWLHFEGRNVDDTLRMMQLARTKRPELTLSVEIEKPRQQIEQLIALADVVMLSKVYAQSRGFDSATALLNSLSGPQLFSCTWGEQGAWLKQGTQLWHSPATPPAQLVDTLGAGDTFNAGLIDALSRQLPAAQALQIACELAGRKCGQQGFTGLVI